MHVYITEVIVRCPNYRWWGCYGEEEEIRIPMPSRPYCPLCVTTGEEQIRREYIFREQGVIKDAENKHWSTETLNDARKKLSHAQRAAVRGLRDMGEGETALAKTGEYTHAEGPYSAEIEV